MRLFSKALVIVALVLAVNAAATSACPPPTIPHSLAIPVVAPHHNGGLDLVACSSQANCAGVGYFKSKGQLRMWSVTEVSGVWGWSKRKILTADAPTFVSAMACPSKGDCVVVG